MRSCSRESGLQRLTARVPRTIEGIETFMRNARTRRRAPPDDCHNQCRSARRRTWGRRLFALVVALAATANHSLLAQNRDFIWKASRGPSVVYLVGSVHLLSKDYYPLSPALDKAFKECDLLVEELHLGQMAQVESQMTILMSGMLPAGQTLDKVVSPATFRSVSERVSRSASRSNR